MPTAAKTVAAMGKHLTKAEIEAREAAESGVIPQRDEVKLEIPNIVKKDSIAKKYWISILKRMEGLSILDDLDSEMLSGYCLQLARRDRLVALHLKMTKDTAKEKDAELSLKLIDKLDTLTAKLSKLDTSLLTYADKLGLTPTGRARLAQKRAETENQAADPDADLYAP